MFTTSVVCDHRYLIYMAQLEELSTQLAIKYTFEWNGRMDHATCHSPFYTGYLSRPEQSALDGMADSVRCLTV